MTATEFPVDDYLAHLGLSDVGPVTIGSLTKLHRAQAFSIPFSNVDIYRGGRRLLAIEAIVENVLRRRRGGYCYELNGLFAAALEYGRFEVTRLMARNLMRPEVERQKTHMCLLATIRGRRFLCDQGFGVFGPVEPIPLEVGYVCKQHGLTYQMQSCHIGYRLAMRKEDAWEPLYEFSLETYPAIDFEIAHFYNSTAEQSVYRKNLIASLPLMEGRAFLRNSSFTHYADGQVYTESFESDALVDQALRNVFRLRL